MFVILIKGDVTERLIGHELFFFWILPCKVKIGVPGAGIEIDLVAAVIVVIKRDGFLMVRVSVDDVTRRVIMERRLIQGEFCKGMITAEQPSVLQFIYQIVKCFDRDQP